MDINQVDWSEIWKQGVIFFGGGADKATSWDRSAPRWNKEDAGDYGQKVLKRIKIRPNWTVLDVGCGPGLLAVPMAKKCKHLTALDISPQMLSFLKQRAEKENIQNISYINMPFETAEIGKDLVKHDVVVASRSMGWEYNLERFLRGMDQAAEKRAYVIWGADERWFDIDLYKAIGRPYGETRTYIVIYNLLYQMGIRANIEIFQAKVSGMSYGSIDEAILELTRRFERRNNDDALTQEEIVKLRPFFEANLSSAKDGSFSLFHRKPFRHALIWWDKRLN